MEEDGMDYGRTLNIMDLSLGRAPEPETTDGQVGAHRDLNRDAV